MTQFVNARVHLKENATLGFGVLHMDPETAESNKKTSCSLWELRYHEDKQW
jgi:hypothetical protein